MANDKSGGIGTETPTHASSSRPHIGVSSRLSHGRALSASATPTDGTMPSRAAGNMPCAASPSNRDGGQWSAAAARPTSSQPGLTRAP